MSQYYFSHKITESNDDGFEYQMLLSTLCIDPHTNSTIIDDVILFKESAQTKSKAKYKIKKYLKAFIDKSVGKWSKVAYENIGPKLQKIIQDDIQYQKVLLVDQKLRIPSSWTDEFTPELVFFLKNSLSYILPNGESIELNFINSLGFK